MFKCMIGCRLYKHARVFKKYKFSIEMCKKISMANRNLINITLTMMTKNLH